MSKFKVGDKATTVHKWMGDFREVTILGCPSPSGKYSCALGTGSLSYSVNIFGKFLQPIPGPIGSAPGGAGANNTFNGTWHWAAATGGGGGGGSGTSEGDQEAMINFDYPKECHCTGRQLFAFGHLEHCPEAK